MLDQPVTRQTATPQIELPEAVDAQVREAHERVRGDAADAGVDPRLADAAMDAARARYGNAQPHAFIGVLIERQSSEAQHL